MSTLRALTVASLASVLVAGGTTRAEAEAEVTLALTASGQRELPPDIVARVVGGGAPPTVDQLALVQDAPGGPISIAAYPDGLATYVEGDETLGLVIVVEVHGVWLGNQGLVEESEPGSFVGVYKELIAAIDGLSKAGPPGSKGAIVTYGKGAQLSEMGIVELADLRGYDMGTPKSIGQAEKYGHSQRDLVAGIQEGVAVLNKLNTARKALVVFGDGQDTNHDQGLAQLTALGKQLAADGIEVHAVYLESMLEGDPNGYKKLTGNVDLLTDVGGLAPAVDRVVDRIADRYYVRFPGTDMKLKTAFAWDGQPHPFSVRIGGDVLDAGELVLSPGWTPPWVAGATPPEASIPSKSKEKAKGCGCATGAADPGPASLLTLAVIVTLGRRRKRSIRSSRC